MIVKKAKTDATIFAKNLLEANFDIDWTIVRSGSCMKMLVLTFQHNLEWSMNVDSTLNKIKPKLFLLKKDMEKDQFLKIATAQLYSLLYYASQLWLNKTLKAPYWVKLRLLRYRLLCGVVKDYKQKRF